jgi:hypothetical protein
MLETLLERPFFLNRHQKAPLLKEREVFLWHLQQQGTSRVALRNLSGELIHVVRLLRLEKLRDVGQDEIQRAAQRWARQQRSNPKAHSYGNTASFFIYAAKKWLRFHGCLKLPSAPLTLEAEEALARFMANQWPDDELFGDLVIELITRARANRRCVRVVWRNGRSPMGKG